LIVGIKGARHLFAPTLEEGTTWKEGPFEKVGVYSCKKGQYVMAEITVALPNHSTGIHVDKLESPPQIQRLTYTGIESFDDQIQEAQDYLNPFSHEYTLPPDNIDLVLEYRAPDGHKNLTKKVTVPSAVHDPETNKKVLVNVYYVKLPNNALSDTHGYYVDYNTLGCYGMMSDTFNLNNSLRGGIIYP